MRFLITSVTGRKGYKSFKDLNEYVDFMTKKGHLIKDLQEAEVPYTEKPVKMVKATQSKGWEEVSDFGDVDKDPEKSASLIASTSSSVMKDEANMEFSKSSEKADKNEKGLGGESGDINMSDFKSFDYSEPELESSKNASKAQVEYKEVKNETPIESKKEDSEPKEEKKEDKKEEKKDSSKKYDKDIEECLKAAGVQLNEFFKFDSDNSGKDDSNEKFIEELTQEVHSLGRNSLFIKACVNALKKLGGNGGFGADGQSRQSIERFINEVNKLIRKYTGKSEYAASSSTLKGLCEFIDSLPYEQSSKIIDDLIQVVYNNCDSYAFNLICDEVAYASSHGRINESIKDYLPRAGFIRSDDEDKSSSKMGVWGGQGTDEQLRKAKIIAKVKFANGDRMGRVTKDDLEHFDEYKAQYDEIYGSDEELEEGWKDKLKKGAAAIGVAGALAGNAMASDPMYDGARSPDTLDHTQEYSQSVDNVEKPQIKRITKNGMIIDQFGNEWTREEFDKLVNGEDPYYDGARNPNIEESEEVIEEDDDELNLEIAECLKAAGC